MKNGITFLDNIKYKRFISILLSVIFLISGMCFEKSETDSYFSYTNHEQYEVIGISKIQNFNKDMCIQDLLGTNIKEKESIHECRGPLKQNSRLRLLMSQVQDYVESSAYMSGVAAEKLIERQIFRSSRIIYYIHAKDGEK